MELSFKSWLFAEDDMRSGCKLGLYPPLADSLGQYPPLYLAAHAADFVTYYDIFYRGVKGKNGIIPSAPFKKI